MFTNFTKQRIPACSVNVLCVSFFSCNDLHLILQGLALGSCFSFYSFLSCVEAWKRQKYQVHWFTSRWEPAFYLTLPNQRHTLYHNCLWKWRLCSSLQLAVSWKLALIFGWDVTHFYIFLMLKKSYTPVNIQTRRDHNNHHYVQQRLLWKYAVFLSEEYEAHVTMMRLLEIRVKDVLSSGSNS